MRLALACEIYLSKEAAHSLKDAYQKTKLILPCILLPYAFSPEQKKLLFYTNNERQDSYNFNLLDTIHSMTGG